MNTLKLILFVFVILFLGCNKENPQNSVTKELTIFFVNDVHGQIDNFSKVKHIIDVEKSKTNVIVVSSGDMFSGNPVVDNYEEKGMPIIDVMNQTGFDISVLGNHEFDYGVDVLKNRIEQSDFPWICANVDVNSTGLLQPPAFHTITVDGLKITFLGLIETGGSKNEIIPASHPWKVKDLTFVPANQIVSDFRSLKTQEDADLLVALSHLGHLGYNDELGDFKLAQQHSFFDLIIGGHSHHIIDTIFGNVPVFQAGGYLHGLGKIELSVKNKKIQSQNFTLIDLDNYSDYNAELKSLIDNYNDLPYLKEVIGYAEQFHSSYQVGCFYTDALRLTMNVDLAFQNTGGVRSALDEGDITVREIYEISPFNNGTVIYEMSVLQVKEFLRGSGSGFYYSGNKLLKEGENILVLDELNRIIPDDIILRVGINDYIPAVHPNYFPDNGEIQSLSAAETLISYLKNINGNVNYAGCNQYFRY